MRTFKIIVLTVLLLVLAGLALVGLKNIIPSSVGPDEEELGSIYHEDHETEEADDLYSQTVKQYEGVVKPIGVSIYMEGTHRLEADDELVALLVSDKVNLPDFEGKEVKVTGTVKDTVEGGQKIMNVRFIEQLKEAGVKAFSEAGYEFSFSYPADWETEKEKDKVTFTRERENKEENIMIVYQFQDVKDPLDTWLKDRDQNLFFTETQVKVGEVTGVRRTVTNGDQEIIKTYAKAGNNAYELRLLVQDEVTRNQYFSIVDFFQTSFSETAADTPEELPEEEESPAEITEAEDPQETPVEEETPEEPVEEEPAEQQPEEEETTPEEAPEEPEETPAETTEESSESFSGLEPLSADVIQNVIDKGFAPFEGRTLHFQYPKVWYFSYLGDGSYGFTDGDSYEANDNEVTQANSRMLLIAGSVSVSCTATKTATVESTTYTVCTREPGLSEIADAVADSIKKPEATE